MNNTDKFIFNKETLITNLKGYQEIATVYYPLKTNSNINIIKCLNNKFQDNQNGFLISNIQHFETLKSLNISPQKMCLINVFTNIETIIHMYQQGLRFFVIDNLETIKTLNKSIDLKQCKIAIRISLTNKTSHIGVSIPEAIAIIDYLKHKCDNIGISYYLNQCSSKPYSFDKTIIKISKSFKAHPIKFLSIGGVPESCKINVKLLSKINYEIILEPGRFLLADTLSLQTQIVNTKLQKNEILIIIKNGIYSGFFDKLLFNRKYDIAFLANKQYTNLYHTKKPNHNFKVYLYGASSDSKDFLGVYYINKKNISDIIKNKTLLIKNIGAYFETVYSNYDTPREIVYRKKVKNEI